MAHETLESLIQAKNGRVAGVSAPDLHLYPNGYTDTIRLPLSVSWLVSSTIDTSNAIRIGIYQVDVLVERPGQGNFNSNKQACAELLQLFQAEYVIEAPDTTNWLRNCPVAYIVPGSVEFTGYRDLIEAPDESLYHGFQFNLTVNERVNQDCG